MHLATNLDRIFGRSRSLLKSNDSDEVALIGPYLGRAALELGMTTLVSRFDPMRILAIRKVQLSPTYDLSIRNQMAFDWAADVQGRGKAKSWDQLPKLTELERALLGDHYQDLFWTEAFQFVLDEIPDDRGGAWMMSLRRITPEGYTTNTRQEASRLFSHLSKGVHQELVIPAAAQFDIPTVNDLLIRTFELLASLGLTACYSPSLRVPSNFNPIDAYETCQEEFS